MKMARILAAGISLSTMVWACAGTDGISGPSAGNGGGGAGSGGGGSAGTVAGGGGAGRSAGASGMIVTTPPPVDGGGQLNGDAACVATAMEGEQRPVALFLMMDSSGSMNDVDKGQTQSRWQLIATAVPAFLSDPSNVGLFAGLDFFPEPASGGSGGSGGTGISCSVTDYENPNVPIAIVPGANNAQVTAFANAIKGRTVQAETPTTPALQGAIHVASLWQAAHPEMNTFVVFMTDGQPNGCSSTVKNAAAAAASGVAGTPSIKTYVLGVGPSTGNLDAIAVAGGTGPKAYLVTTGGAAALTAALNAIKGTALSCDYKVPAPARGGTLDFTAVNVQTRVGFNGTQSIVRNVPDATACGTADGWYYDQPLGGSTPPTTITLCPSSCSALTSNNGSQLLVLIGCKTVTSVR